LQTSQDPSSPLAASSNNGALMAANALSEVRDGWDNEEWGSLEEDPVRSQSKKPPNSVTYSIVFRLVRGGGAGGAGAAATAAGQTIYIIHHVIQSAAPASAAATSAATASASAAAAAARTERSYRAAGQAQLTRHLALEAIDAAAQGAAQSIQQQYVAHVGHCQLQ